MTAPIQKIGRLALRREGVNWNAYYAMPDTMDGAIFLGSIAMRLVIDNETRKQAFMRMMQDSVADLLQELTGKRPVWPDGIKLAPPYERVGHG